MEYLKDLNTNKETIIIEEEIIGEFFYKECFSTLDQNPEVIKEIIDKFEYIKIKNTINKVRKTNNKLKVETATRITRVL